MPPLSPISSVPPSSLTLLSLSGDDLFAEIQSGHRAQPQLLAEHCCSDLRLHQRGRTSHGGKLPGKPEMVCTALCLLALDITYCSVIRFPLTFSTHVVLLSANFKEFFT